MKCIRSEIGINKIETKDKIKQVNMKEIWAFKWMPSTIVKSNQL